MAYYVRAKGPSGCKTKKERKPERYTVKPAHAVTSTKQSPVLKGRPFLVLSYKTSYELDLF